MPLPAPLLAPLLAPPPLHQGCISSSTKARLATPGLAQPLQAHGMSQAPSNQSNMDAHDMTVTL